MPGRGIITGTFMKAGRKLERSSFLTRLATAIFCFSATLLLLAGAEEIFVFQESSALAATVLCVVFLLLVAAFLAARLLTAKIQPSRLALEIEKRHPELMDSLVCAVEKEEIPPEQRRILEQELIKSVSEGNLVGSIEKELVPRGVAKLRLAALAGAIIALLAFSGTRFFEKTVGRLAEAAGMAEPGLKIIPGNAEVEEGSDLKVRAIVGRWENEAEITLLGPDGERRFRMPPGKDRNPEFTIYDVSGKMRYSVRTPSLSSEEFTIATYRPPSIDKSQMKIVPPKYTGRETRNLEPIQDATAPFGSTVVLNLKTGGAAKAALAYDGKTADFAVAPDPAYSHMAEMEILKNTECAICLEDSRGRSRQMQMLRIECIPDLPPAVDIVEPRDDLTAPPGAKIKFQASATDDYGIAEVDFAYSVSSQEEKNIPARMEPGTGKGDRTRMDCGIELDLSAAGAAAGDIICCSFTAEDNRVPDPNRSRSKIIFIEVREKFEKKEVDGSGEMDIFRFVAELKRLIRMTYDVISSDPERKAEIGRELADNLSKLRTELSSELARLSGLKPDDQGIRNLQVMLELSKAEEAARAGQHRESLPPQMKALSILTAMAQELMKNKPKNSQSGKGGETQDDQQGKGAEGQKSLKELMAEMNDMLAQLGSLAGRQNSLNSDISSLPEKDSRKEEGQELARKQESIRKELDALRGKMPGGIDLSKVEGQASSASGSMGKAAQKLGGKNPRSSLADGRDAHYSLLSSMEALRDAIRNVAAAQIEAVASGAERLSKMQGGEAERSRRTASDPSAAGNSELRREMRNSQNSLSEMEKNLADRAEELSYSLAEEYPEASGQLQKAVEGGSGIGASMKKATNSLLYGKFDKAAENQDSASRQLAEFADSVRSSKKYLPLISQEEIMALLGKIADSAERLREERRSGGKSQNASSIAGDIGRSISTAGEDTGDFDLSAAGNALQRLDFGGNPDASFGKAAELMARAEFALRKHLAAMQLRKKTDLRRKTSSPPEKYREMVEEYFKSLSR